MNAETYAMLQEWLENGDDSQRSHAKHRLSMPDAMDYQYPKPEYPSIFQQAGNLARSVGEVVSGTARGDPVLVSQEEHDRRLEICQKCEHFRDGRCMLCGCIMKWKTRLASLHCPDDPPRW